MRLSTALATVLALTLAQPAFAVDKDDENFILNSLFSPENTENIRKSVAEGLTRAYAAYLKEKSVDIVNEDKFGQLIPEAITDPWMASIKEDARRCIRQAPPEQLEVAVKYVRQMELKEQATEQQEVASENAALKEIQSNEDGIAWLLFSCLIVAGLSGASITKDLETGPAVDISFLADILEADGVARFPNRILRKDILAEIRATSIFSSR